MSITLASSNDHASERQDTNGPTGKATASLVLGIASIPGSVVPFIGVPLSIVGLVMAAKGMKSTSTGQAKAGLVLSIIGATLSTVVMVVGFAHGFAAGQ